VAARLGGLPVLGVCGFSEGIDEKTVRRVVEGLVEEGFDSMRMSPVGKMGCYRAFGRVGVASVVGVLPLSRSLLLLALISLISLL